MKNLLIITGLFIILTSSKCERIPDYPLPEVPDCRVLFKGGCFCIYQEEEYILTPDECAGFKATSPEGEETLLNDRDSLVKELRKCKRNPKKC